MQPSVASHIKVPPCLVPSRYLTLAFQDMGRRWSTSTLVSSAAKAFNGSDGDVCPICLESCSAGPREKCEHGHTMHRECAKAMSSHMKLECPLCRSKLICGECRSEKAKVQCNCTYKLYKARNRESVWEIQQICKTHFFISVGTYLLPFVTTFNQATVLVGILLNSSFMLHRVVKCQRRSEETRSSSLIVRIMTKITQIGMEIMTVGLLLLAVVVALLDSDFSVR